MRELGPKSPLQQKPSRRWRSFLGAVPAFWITTATGDWIFFLSTRMEKATRRSIEISGGGSLLTQRERQDCISAAKEPVAPWATTTMTGIPIWQSARAA